MTYVDAHTADRQQQRKVLKTVSVVGTALVAITDGANADVISGVVLDKTANLRVIDADGDQTDAADRLAAEVHVYRLKSDEELEAENPRKRDSRNSDGSDPAVNSECQCTSRCTGEYRGRSLETNRYREGGIDRIKNQQPTRCRK